MKRFFGLITTIIVLLFTMSSLANAENIYINDQLAQYTSIQTDNGMFIPLRAISEELGYKVVWNRFNKSIIVIKSKDCLNAKGVSDVVELSTESPGITVWYPGSEEFEIIDTIGITPVIKDGNTYCSAFYFCRALDLKLRSRDDELYIYTR